MQLFPTSAITSHREPAYTGTVDAAYPVLVCLLGQFRVLKAGQPIPLHGGKAETLLYHLALHQGRASPRDILLNTLWPDSTRALATQSLNSLLYSLRKLLSDGIDGEPPILHQDGYYWLNREAGVEVDVTCFDNLAKVGNQFRSGGNHRVAARIYIQAVQLYQGDLCTEAADLNASVERERLRGRFLCLLAYLADYYFSDQDYTLCLDYAQRLLRWDPCREDAHRVVMRCYVRRGERAQALRQYRLCQSILHAEFDATPEASTTLLFDQVRLDPGSV